MAIPLRPGPAFDERDAVGIYRVLSYHVRLRTHEFGIRTAIGLAGAVALARIIMGDRYGLSAFDPTNCDIALGVSQARIST